MFIPSQHLSSNSSNIGVVQINQKKRKADHFLSNSGTHHNSDFTTNYSTNLDTNLLSSTHQHNQQQQNSTSHHHQHGTDINNTVIGNNTSSILLSSSNQHQNQHSNTTSSTYLINHPNNPINNSNIIYHQTQYGTNNNLGNSAATGGINHKLQVHNNKNSGATSDLELITDINNTTVVRTSAANTTQFNNSSGGVENTTFNIGTGTGTCAGTGGGGNVHTDNTQTTTTDTTLSTKSSGGTTSPSTNDNTNDTIIAQTFVRASTIKLLDTYQRCGQKVRFYYHLFYISKSLIYWVGHFNGPDFVVIIKNNLNKSCIVRWLGRGVVSCFDSKLNIVRCGFVLSQFRF